MRQTFKRKIMIALLMPVFAAPLTGLTSESEAEISAATPSNGSSKAQAFRDMRATTLMGMEVNNLAGEDLGEIKDLIVDLENERVYYAVLSFGGFLGLGDKLFAYPVRAFKAAADDDVLMLNVSEEKLKAAPGFDAGKDPADWNQYRAEVDRYFGPTTTVKPMANQKLRRASNLIGKDVNDPTDKDVGDIEDIVVNMTNGRIRYVVLDFDEPWSLDDKLMPLPMSAFSTTPDRDELVINVDKSKLDARRAFDPNQWPNLNDPKYIVDIDRYVLTFTTATTAGDLFKKLDTNNDGTLTKAEGAKRSEVNQAWGQLDLDDDGKVNRADFLAYRW